MARKQKALAPEDLRYVCEVGCIPFQSTDDAPDLKEPVGQERALHAIDFGLRIKNPGYNLFAVGEPGCGKSSTVTTMVNNIAAREEVPLDWAYVHNFENPRRPVALSFAATQGRIFVRQMKELLDVLKKNIPAALEDKDFESRRGLILDKVNRENASDLAQFQKQSKEAGYSFEQIENEYGFIPLREDKKLHRDEFEALPDEVKKEYNESLMKLQDGLREITRLARKRDEDAHRKVNALSRQQVQVTVEPFVGYISSIYPDDSKVQRYLKLLLDDILDHYQEFLADKTQPAQIPGGGQSISGEPPFARYQVNLIVDRTEQHGAPIVYENHPTFQNLVGRIEYALQFGVATTSFTQIQPGALHLANGGYLILDAIEVLRSPFAWESIKNNLKSSQIKIEDMGEQYRMFATGSLKPEPIPLSIKVILIGTPFIYYQLLAHEEDFRKLFKVKADFGSTMKRTDEAIQDYALFIAALCREEDLLPFDVSAMGAVVENGVRLAEDKGLLSTSFYQVADLVREASFWAANEDAQKVSRPHVARAIQERKHRYDRVEKRLGELIEEGTLMVRTKGQVVGQVNGLSVYTMGDYRFGKPTRITAKVYLGKAGMVNIEREVKLSGSIHSKGVMIVSSYLAMRYASDFPLGLSASVTFEQTYDEVEGDSATAAELVALTSAVAGTPVYQNFAITGSMDQHGGIQPVGGINEKIEGFFTSCRDHGLDGDEGIVIPRANVKNLMLTEEIVEAVAGGKFTIYAVDTIDEAIELLTGMRAGERGKNGMFPKGSFNRMVEDRLREMASLIRICEEGGKDQ